MRAHATYAVGSTLAAGALGAIAANWRESEALVTKLAACSAIVAWMAAAGFYVASLTKRPREQAAGTSSKAAFVDAVVSRAKAERDRVERTQRVANTIAATALALTAATFCCATLLSTSAERRPVKLMLTPAGAKTLTALCGALKGGVLAGTTRSALTGTGPIELEVRGNACGRDAETVMVPRSALAAAVVMKS